MSGGKSVRYEDHLLLGNLTPPLFDIYQGEASVVVIVFFYQQQMHWIENADVLELYQTLSRIQYARWGLSRSTLLEELLMTNRSMCAAAAVTAPA
jgi:hypothetical protein